MKTAPREWISRLHPGAAPEIRRARWRSSRIRWRFRMSWTRLPGAVREPLPAQSGGRGNFHHAVKKGGRHADMALPERYVPAPRRPSTGKRVAVVGAGPAGSMRVFPGAVRARGRCLRCPSRAWRHAALRNSVVPPAHAIIDAEVETIARLGVHFHYGQVMGRDFHCGFAFFARCRVFGLGAQESSS